MIATCAGLLACSAELKGADDDTGSSDDPSAQAPAVDQLGLLESPDYGQRGVLDCPTVDPPPYTQGDGAELSKGFQTSCAGCHGARGEGSLLYPAINEGLSLAEYKKQVRKGGTGMPAFEASFISDRELEADYELLRNGSQDDAPAPQGDEWTWSDERVAQAYEQGLQAWRKPDPHGLACANCHSPDGIDLAVIGYPDDAILRRAALHVPPEDAARVVDFIHAQRRRFEIARPCARSWCPLQPGGTVLPGDTPQEQDTSFAKELDQRDYMVVNGKVETYADARAAFAEMVDIDLRRLPIAIAFPRWTEDGFNGEAHSTINDYLMGVGRAPKDPDEWYALEDAYIAEPSKENLFPLIRHLEEKTHDTGYAEDAEEANHEANGRCHRVRNQGGLLGFSDLKKKQSLLIVQHFMRMAALGKPGWYEEPKAPLVEYGEQLNPFYHLGSQFAEHNCRNASAMLASWPEEPAEEIPQSDWDGGVAEELNRQINHSWQTLGMIYDQPLMMRETAGMQNLHYWVLNGFVQKAVHLPFLYAHRVVQQSHYWEELRGTDLHPGPIGHFSGIKVHPLLDGRRLMMKTGQNWPVEGDDIRARVSNSVRCNVFRMFLLMQKDLFEKGEPGNYTKGVQNNTQSLTANLGEWELWAERFERQGGGLQSGLADDRALCTTGLLELVAEVRSLAESADDIGD